MDFSKYKTLNKIFSSEEIPIDIKRTVYSLSDEGKQLLNDYYDEQSYFYKNFADKNIINKFYAAPKKHPVLYHYTSVNALKGIVSSKQLIINSAHKMNDDKEIIYSKQMALEIFKIYSNKNDEINLFKRQLNMAPDNIYLMSFTDNNHSQALLNNYGNIAIGMKNQELQNFFGKAGAHGKQDFKNFDENDFYTFPLKVNYNKDFQKKTLKSLIKRWITAYRNINIDFQDMSSILASLNADIFYLSLLFKRPVLYQEEEIRYIIVNKKSSDYVNFNNPMYIEFDKKLFSNIIYGHDLEQNKKYINDILIKNGFNNVKLNLTSLPY